MFDRLAGRLSYLHGDVNDGKLYTQLADQIGPDCRPLFYLEMPPALFAPIVENLAKARHSDHPAFALDGHMFTIEAELDRERLLAAVPAAIERAAKNAVREFARTRIPNKPRKVTGSLVLSEAPRIVIVSGVYRAVCVFKLRIDETTPYRAF